VYGLEAEELTPDGLWNILRTMYNAVFSVVYMILAFVIAPIVVLFSAIGSACCTFQVLEFSRTNIFLAHFSSCYWMHLIDYITHSLYIEPLVLFSCIKMHGNHFNSYQRCDKNVPKLLHHSMF